MSPEATSFPNAPANLQNRSPVTTRAIAGIVVGSVIALTLLVIIVVHVARRRNKAVIDGSTSIQNEKTQDGRYNLVPGHRPTLPDAVATSPLLDAPPSFSYDLERLENYSQQSSHTTPRSLNNATQVHLLYDLTASSTSADSPEYHEPLLFPSPPLSSAQLCTSPEQISSAPLPQHEVPLSSIQGSNSISHNSRPSAPRDHGLGQTHQSLSTVTNTLQADTDPALLNFSFSRRKSRSSKPNTTTRVRQTGVAGAQTFMPSSGFRNSPSERPAATRVNSAPSLNHATRTANPLRPDSFTDTGEIVGSTVPRSLAKRTNSEMTAQQIGISSQDWPRTTSNVGADAHGSILPRGASRAVTETLERPTALASPSSNHTYSPSQQPQLYRLESPPPTPNEPLTRAFRTSIRSESTNASSTPSLSTLRHYPSITGSSATYVTAPSEAADANDWEMFRAGLIAAKHQTRSLASRANQIREIDDPDGTQHKPVGERMSPPIRLPSTLRPGNARSSPSQLHAPLDLDAPRATYTHKSTVSSPAALPPVLRAGGGNGLSLQVSTTLHPHALQPGSAGATEPRPHRAHLRTPEALRVRTEPRVPRSSRLKVKSSSSAIVDN
jgi:hypothetical protein